MKKITLLTFIVFLSSCYSYQLIDPTKEVATSTTKETLNTNPNTSKRSAMRAEKMEIIGEISKPKTTETKSGDLKLYIKPNGIYKLTVQQKQHHIVAQSWIGDTLVASPKGKEKQTLKFHKNDIDQTQMYDRKFSKRKSDIITVGAYAVALAGLIFLII
ncbi:hypothetical protein ACF3NR_10750 [Vaginella massiliensis]|uniref:hypothetical protein n=1 Tax=Vaginella massiliensis TaxID=1816680 RepID=UPI0037500E78